MIQCSPSIRLRYKSLYAASIFNIITDVTESMPRGYMCLLWDHRDLLYWNWDHNSYAENVALFLVTLITAVHYAKIATEIPLWLTEVLKDRIESSHCDILRDFTCHNHAEIVSTTIGFQRSSFPPENTVCDLFHWNECHRGGENYHWDHHCIW